MKQEIKNYIAEKIYNIAFSLMPRSEIKTNLAIWFIENYGGKQ